MKSILLASVASVAFAGVAAAEVTFSGEASLGYNNTDQATITDDNVGFYSDLSVSIGLSQELDNGLTVAASIDLEDLADGAVSDSDYVLSITSDTAGLYFGDTQHAAKNVWKAVGDMDADTFRTQDGESVLRGEVTLGGVAAQVSYGIDAADELEGLSVGLSGDMGNVNFVLAYQQANTLTVDGDDNSAATAEEVLALRVGTTLGGADVALGYASNTTNGNSTGISVSYPAGPVTLAASYVMESAGDANWNISAAYANGPLAVKVATDESSEWAIDGSYDVGNGISATFGTNFDSDLYVGGTYDLGGGASLLVSYAKDGSGDSEDEIGANDYQEGTTVEVSFAF